MSMNDDEAKKIIAATLKDTGLFPVDTWCDELTEHIMQNLKAAGFGFSNNTDDFSNNEDN